MRSQKSSLSMSRMAYLLSCSCGCSSRSASLTSELKGCGALSISVIATYRPAASSSLPNRLRHKANGSPSIADPSIRRRQRLSRRVSARGNGEKFVHTSNDRRRNDMAICRAPLTKEKDTGKRSRWRVILYNPETHKQEWHTVEGTRREAETFERQQKEKLSKKTYVAKAARMTVAEVAASFLKECKA